MRQWSHIQRNVFGGFADAAVLLPLMVLYSMLDGAFLPFLMASAGYAYIGAALFFQMPMPVQPLKSIAVGAVAVSATFAEVRLCAGMLGAVCVIASLIRVDRWMSRVPVVIIHQVQAALGALLVFQGMKLTSGLNAMFLVSVAACLIFFLPNFRGIPILGVLATGGMAFALLNNESFPSSSLIGGYRTGETPGIRWGTIFGLLLPQLALTSVNSVLATREACERLYGESSRNVSVRRLFASIGFGNLLMSAAGGMPFCHGSGGVTAHHRGGSTAAWSTALFGGLLLLVSHIYGSRPDAGLVHVGDAQVAVFAMPQTLGAILLVAIGFSHFKLAAPTFSSRLGAAKVISVLSVVILTRSLMTALIAAIICECLDRWRKSHDSVQTSVRFVAK